MDVDLPVKQAFHILYEQVSFFFLEDGICLEGFYIFRMYVRNMLAYLYDIVSVFSLMNWSERIFMFFFSPIQDFK